MRKEERENYLAKLGDVTKPKHRPIDNDVKKFIEEYIKTGNATQSIMTVYQMDTRAAAAQAVQKMLRNSDVRDVVKLYAHRAVHRIERLAEGARSEKVRLEANQDIMDRAGVLPPVAAPAAPQALVIVLPQAVADKNKISATPVPFREVDDEK